MVIPSTDFLDESIRFYTETIGMALKFRDGAHYAALDGGSIIIALAAAVDHPCRVRWSSASGPTTSMPSRGLSGRRWCDRAGTVRRRTVPVPAGQVCRVG